MVGCWSVYGYRSQEAGGGILAVLQPNMTVGVSGLHLFRDLLTKLISNSRLPEQLRENSAFMNPWRRWRKQGDDLRQVKKSSF